MCGIFGFISFDGSPVSVGSLRQMGKLIEPRGPDGEGYFVDRDIGVGHRRLSIIDLSAAAHQPMTSNEGRYVLSYNGEVYNFKEIRCDLEAKGHRFKSQSDSEVVLTAFIEWGEKCLDHFNGMFAFAIWDKVERRLFLARDRYGIKPLYVFQSPKGLAFASEIKAFYGLTHFQTSMDVEGLYEYLSFQNFFSEKTLWKNVHCFPAGSFQYLTATRQEPINQYWDYHFEEPTTSKPDEAYIEELLYLFQQAVKRQLVSDVELGSFLSSGMDSGSITAIAARHLPYMKTFTIGFDLHSASGLELSFDEREKAEYMSYLFKTEHYEMVLKAGDMERAFPKMGWHIEEPRVGQSYPNFYAAQLASKFCKVVLGGSGGDELFGGYPWRYYRAVRNQNFNAYVEKYFSFWQRLLNDDESQRVFNPIWAQVKHRPPREIFRSVFKQHADQLSRPADFVNHSLYLEAKMFLHGLFIVDDKLSMAHSLETRVPFMDNDLVDFSMRLPVRLKLGHLEDVLKIDENDVSNKIQKYFEKTRDGKLILRKALSRFMPEKITNEVKQGFSAPDASWFKGESINYVRRILFDQSSKIYDSLDRKEVQKLVTEHLEGKANRRLLIWSLLSLDQWHNSFDKQNVGASLARKAEPETEPRVALS